MATLENRLKALEAGDDDAVIVIRPHRLLDDMQAADSTEHEVSAPSRGYERIIITNPRDFD